MLLNAEYEKAMETNISRYQANVGRLIKLSDRLYSDLAIVASGKKVKKSESEPEQIFIGGLFKD